VVSLSSQGRRPPGRVGPARGVGRVAPGRVPVGRTRTRVRVSIAGTSGSRASVTTSSSPGGRRRGSGPGAWRSSVCCAGASGSGGRPRTESSGGVQIATQVWASNPRGSNRTRASPPRIHASDCAIGTVLTAGSGGCCSAIQAASQPSGRVLAGPRTGPGVCIQGEGARSVASGWRPYRSPDSVRARGIRGCNR
jgi:hypothetical protein